MEQAINHIKKYIHRQSRGTADSQVWTEWIWHLLNAGVALRRVTHVVFIKLQSIKYVSTYSQNTTKLYYQVLYNVSTTLYFTYNKNSVLSGRHVSTFIRSSSDPLGKQIQELSIFQCIVGSQMH